MNIFSSQLLLDSLGSHGLYEWTNDGTYSFTLGRKTLVHFILVCGGTSYTDTYIDMRPTFDDFFKMNSGGAGGAYYNAYAELPAGTYYVEIANSQLVTLEKTYKNKTYVCKEPTKPTISLQNGYNVELLGLVATQINKANTYEVSYQKTVVTETTGNSAAQDSNGRYYVGGASLYNGYGKGADFVENNQTTGNHTNGYVKVEY